MEPPSKKARISQQADPIEQAVATSSSNPTEQAADRPRGIKAMTPLEKELFKDILRDVGGLNNQQIAAWFRSRGE